MEKRFEPFSHAREATIAANWSTYPNFSSPASIASKKSEKMLVAPTTVARAICLLNGCDSCPYPPPCGIARARKAESGSSVCTGGKIQGKRHGVYGHSRLPPNLDAASSGITFDRTNSSMTSSEQRNRAESRPTRLRKLFLA